VEFVCRDALARWAEGMNLAHVLMKGKSLKNSVSPSVFADAMEAVIGAVYLDGGFDAAVRVIRRYLFGSETSANGGTPDAKSRLQVLLQAGEKGLPRYEILSMTGPSHSPLFRVRVHAGGRAWEGEGSNRKAAELKAAARALSALAPENFPDSETTPANPEGPQRELIPLRNLEGPQGSFAPLSLDSGEYRDGQREPRSGRASSAPLSLNPKGVPS
jgi:hypothetical protein